MTGDRLIRALIRLYPAEFRRRYGHSMVDFHRERVREGARGWPRVVFDHLTAAAAEHVRALRERRVVSRDDHAPSLLGQDARFAIRGLARRPLFAAIVISTISLGVGANAAIFSVVNGILLRPLPYPDPDRVVSFTHAPPTWLTSAPEFVDYQRSMRSLESLAAFTQSEGNLTSGEEPERVGVAVVSREFFGVLGMRPLVGRSFAPGDDLAPSTAVISYALWQRRFAGDARVVGTPIHFNGRERTIIGVMPQHFDYPTARTDVWLPMARFHPDSVGDRSNHYLSMVGRVRAGLTIERVVDDAATVARTMMRDHAANYDPNSPLVPAIAPVSDGLVGPTRPYLWTLFGAVGFVLLIVCVNVANLLLARGESRRKEMAVRTALGASRGRMLAQLLTESIVYALAGGAVGLALAWAGTNSLVAVAPASIPRLHEIRLDWSVLAYTLVLSLGAGVVFGLVPAIRASREAPADALKGAGRALHPGASRRMRRVLVIAEVALAVVMLCGAGMLVRSLVNLQRAELGFDVRAVLTAKVSLAAASYDENRSIAFYAQVLERVRAIPGVVSAGAAGWLPVVGTGGMWGVLAEGQSYDRLPKGPMAVPQQVTTGYFTSMGMPIVAGRDFTEDDRQVGPYTAIVSREMARQLWPNADPIGERFRLGGTSTLMTVVGVVDDIRARGFHDTPEPTMYFPYAQTRETAYYMPRSMNLVVRTAGDPMAVANQVKRIVRSLDATVPVSDVRTLEQVVQTSVASRRFSTALLGAFAALALLLAGIGIYGVISYGVSERRFEIGVRMALGADRSAVLASVLGDGVRMAIVGGALGVAGAVGVGGALRSLLVGVPVVDVVTLVAVALGLVVVAVVASLVPARRATAISASEALRGG